MGCEAEARADADGNDMRSLCRYPRRVGQSFPNFFCSFLFLEVGLGTILGVCSTRAQPRRFSRAHAAQQRPLQSAASWGRDEEAALVDRPVQASTLRLGHLFPAQAISTASVLLRRGPKAVIHALVHEAHQSAPSQMRRKRLLLRTSLIRRLTGCISKQPLLWSYFGQFSSHLSCQHLLLRLGWL